MASETDFLNGALGAAGCQRITSIDDSRAEAGWCRTYYPSLRRGSQRIANWKFSGARLQLTPDVEAPAFGFAYSYGLPSSILKLRVYNGIRVDVPLTDEAGMGIWQWQGGAWRIEGKKLFSNDSTAFIEYNQDVTNPDLWDSLYYEMLEAWLGSKLALAVRHDSARSDKLLQIAMGTWMPMALAVDGQEASVSPYISDDLTWGRTL